MDPNATLAEIRRIIARLQDDDPDPLAWRPSLEDDVHRLAELVNALDTWIISGGALPRNWDRK